MIAKFHLGKSYVASVPWSDEEIDFLKDHLNSLSCAEIGERLNRSASSVSCKRRDLGLKKNRFFKSPPVIFSDEEKDFLRKNYEDMSHQEIAYLLGRSESSVLFWASRLKLKRKKNLLRYFDIPCSEQYAYILGWLFADGSLMVKPRTWMLRLTIAFEDGLYLKPYMNSIFPWKCSFLKRKTEKHQDMLCFSLNSKEVCEFMRDKWELQYKSKYMSDGLVRFLESGGDGCKRCFLRGFFEGDGYVSKSEFYTVLSASIDFDWTNLLKLIPSNIKTKLEYQNREKSRGSRLVMYGSGGSQLFAQYIYNTEFDAALPRKKNIVLAHFEKPYYRDKYGPLMHTSVETL